MKVRSIIVTTAVTLLGGWFLWMGARAAGTVVHASEGEDQETISLLDNCDPNDAAWNSVGGCVIKPSRGDVTFAEFLALRFTPLSPPGSLIGHPSWRISPAYVSTRDNEFRVKNAGGRAHTFTEVANYGGGSVPPLNGDLTPTQECLASPPVLAPGATAPVPHLGKGLHKFQCCIHPWMRAAIRIQ